MSHYWNHNTAFHDEIVADVMKRGGRVLEVGCGDGLLLERLAPFVQEIVGLDLEEQTIELARIRLAPLSLTNISLRAGDFLEMPVPSQEELFDTVICIATLHHMDLERALKHMKQCLAPGGKLIVIGLAADKSIGDYLLAALSLLPIRIFDRIHGGAKGPKVKLADPKESISDIRKEVHKLLPGAKVRRRFYYRYALTWDKL